MSLSGTHRRSHIRNFSVVTGAERVAVIVALPLRCAVWLLLLSATGRLIPASLVTAGSIFFAMALLAAGSVLRWSLLLRMSDPMPAAADSMSGVAVVTSFVPQAEEIAMLRRC